MKALNFLNIGWGKPSKKSLYFFRINKNSMGTYKKSKENKAFSKELTFFRFKNSFSSLNFSSTTLRWFTCSSILLV